MNSKLFTISLILLFYSLLAFSQNKALPKPKTGATLTGKVLEKETRKWVEYATIKLFKSSDSTLIAGCITDTKGEFSLKGVPLNQYYIEYSSMGFYPSRSKSFIIESAKSNLNLGIFELSTATKVLNEVVITGQRTMFNNAIDKKVFNVESDMLSQSGAVTDLLQNIPSVSVSMDGNVSLRGSEDVMIMINGKTSMLTAANRADILQQMSASSVEKIEIITNPSAKYKPDGTSGIINIVLKKNAKQGLNGTATVNAGNRSRYSGNLNLNYNPGKLNLFGTYGYRQDDRLRLNDDHRKMTDSLNTVSYENIHGQETARPVAQFARWGAEYEINKSNQIGINGNLFTRSITRHSLNDYITYDANNILTDHYQRLGTISGPETELGLSGSYTHKFSKEGHEIQFDYEYEHSKEIENSYYNDNYITPIQLPSFDNVLIHNHGDRHNFSLEYKNPIAENMEFEAGFKGEEEVTNFNFYAEYRDNSLLSSLGPIWKKDVTKSNEFRFSEYVNAIYGTLAHTIGTFSYMAGVRLESAVVQSKLITLDSIVPNSYFNIYPTLHMVQKIGKSSELQFNYSRRVNRPENDDLNPFPEYQDPRNLRAGNPKLKPEFINSIEFGYQFKIGKTTLIPTVFYRSKVNGFTQITKLINDSTYLTTETNLSKNQAAGFELLSTLSIGRFLTGNFSTNIFYNQIDASNLGYSSNKSNITWDAKLSSTVTVTKTTMMQLTANYRAPMLTPQGTMLARYGINLGARQNIMKNKASIIVTISDLLNTMKESSTMNTPFLTKNVIRKRDARVFYLGFVYHFGSSTKMKEEAIQFDDKL